MAATISVLGALGLDALIVEPSAAVDAGPLVSPAGSPQGGAERARLEAILGAADEAGLKVYLEGFQAQDRTGDIAAEATAIAAALSATLGRWDSIPPSPASSGVPPCRVPSRGLRSPRTSTPRRTPGSLP